MPTRATKKLLSQRRPRGTGSHVLYSPKNSSITAIIKTILVCNTTASNISFSLWMNDNNTTSGDDFAVYKDSSLIANETKVLSFPEEAFVMRGNTATLLCSSSTASAINYTIFGVEVEET